MESFDVLIYLRDKRRISYSEGVAGLGNNLHRVTTALAKHLPEDCRVSVLATSGGGIAATLAARDLRASRLALFSPSRPSKAPGGIRPAGVNHTDNTRLFFARKHPADQYRAREWCSLKGMPDIEWLDTSSHGTLQHIASTEQLGGFVEWLAGGPSKILN